MEQTLVILGICVINYMAGYFAGKKSKDYEWLKRASTYHKLLDKTVLRRELPVSLRSRILRDFVISFKIFGHGEKIPKERAGSSFIKKKPNRQGEIYMESRGESKR